MDQRFAVKKKITTSVRTSDSRNIIFIFTQVWSKARKMVLAGTPSVTGKSTNFMIFLIYFRGAKFTVF